MAPKPNPMLRLHIQKQQQAQLQQAAHNQNPQQTQLPKNKNTPPIPVEVRARNSPIYKVLEKLGEGGYGAVYKGVKKIPQNNKNGPEEVAIKFENCKTKPEEWEFCDALKGVEGVPKVYYKGKCGPFHITIMELLGPSLKIKWLEDVKKNRSEDEAKEWLMEKAAECIQCLQNIHERGIIHGDVKPGNIVMGRPGTPQEDKIYMIDFGLCCRFRTGNDHAEYNQDLGEFCGTVKYASVNAHLGRILTRRDDLESLAYTFAYLLNGYVHWSAMEKLPDEHYRVSRKKTEVPPSILLGPKRSPFKHFFKLVIDLKFEEQPNYELMKNVFKMKLQDPNKRAKAVTHVDLAQNNFNRRFMLGKDVCQFVSIWTETDYPMEQMFRLNVEEGDLNTVITKVYAEKYIVSEAVYANGYWNLVCNRFATHSQQTWFISDNLLPTFVIDKFARQGYSITTVACCSLQRSLVFMTKGMTYKNIRYTLQDEFPYQWICENWRKDYHIITMCCTSDGEKWVVVMASGTDYEDQVIEFDFIYPSEGVNKRWRQGYHVTSSAGNSHGCVFVFSKRKGKNALLPPIQRSLRTCDLGRAIHQHKERMKQTYVTSLCFGRTIC